MQQIQTDPALRARYVAQMMAEREAEEAAGEPVPNEAETQQGLNWQIAEATRDVAAMRVQDQEANLVQMQLMQQLASQQAQIPKQTAADGNASQDCSNKTALKVGRNDPCPCGSGRKYKQCHGKA